jgi:hypothetical protein
MPIQVYWFFIFTSITASCLLSAITPFDKKLGHNNLLSDLKDSLNFVSNMNLNIYCPSRVESFSVKSLSVLYSESYRTFCQSKDKPMELNIQQAFKLNAKSKRSYSYSNV